MNTFIILLKARLKNRVYVLICLTAFVFIRVISGLSYPYGDNVRVGVVFSTLDSEEGIKDSQKGSNKGSSKDSNKGSNKGSSKDSNKGSNKDGKKDSLNSSFDKSRFEFSEYTNEEKLTEDVRKGVIECGFVLPGDLEKRIENRDLEGSVMVVTSPFSLKASVAREAVFSALLREMSPYIIKEAAGYLGINEGNRIRERLMESSIYDEGIFDVVSLDVPAEEDKGELRVIGRLWVKDKLWTKDSAIRFLTIIVVMTIVYYSAAESFKSGLYECIPVGERRAFIIRDVAAGAIVPVVIGIISLFGCK